MHPGPASTPEDPRPWFRPGLKRMVRSVPWWGFVLPFALAVTIATLYGQEAFPIRPKRRWQEIFGILFTGSATAAGLIIWLKGRQPYQLWTAALLALLLCREIHFAGTSAAIYPGLLVALIVALKHWDSIGARLTRRSTAGLLATGFICYAIAVGVDQRWAKLVGIPGEKRFHVPMEESMELIGHLLIAAALLMARRPESPATS